jgi:hypothetical protein
MIYKDKDGAQYLKICPRGFVNETEIYRVPADKVVPVDSLFETYEDDEPGRWARWLDRFPGVNQWISWSDHPWAERT